MYNRNADTMYRQDTVKSVSAAVTLKPYEQTVLAADGTYSITLPSVGEAQGKFYTFFDIGGGTNTITITSVDDTVLAAAPPIMNAANEKVMLYCDGLRWFMVVGQTS